MVQVHLFETWRCGEAARTSSGRGGAESSFLNIISQNSPTDIGCPTQGPVLNVPPPNTAANIFIAANGFCQLPKISRRHSRRYLHIFLWRRTSPPPIANNRQARHSPSCRREMGRRSSIYKHPMGRHPLYVTSFPYPPTRRPLERILHVCRKEREQPVDDRVRHGSPRMEIQHSTLCHPPQCRSHTKIDLSHPHQQ